MRIEVCEICKRSCCDGVVFATPKPVRLIPESKRPGKIYRTCRTAHTIIEKEDGTFVMEWIMGHGNTFNIEVVKCD